MFPFFLDFRYKRCRRLFLLLCLLLSMTVSRSIHIAASDIILFFLMRNPTFYIWETWILDLLKDLSKDRGGDAVRTGTSCLMIWKLIFYHLTLYKKHTTYWFKNSTCVISCTHLFFIISHKDSFPSIQKYMRYLLQYFCSYKIEIM